MEIFLYPLAVIAVSILFGLIVLLIMFGVAISIVSHDMKDMFDHFE